MKRSGLWSLLGGVILTVVLIIHGCGKKAPEPGAVMDEAMQAGRKAGSFPAADEDYFKDMDGGVQLTSNEIKGRNNWIVWTGGNDRFWDHLVNKSDRCRRFPKNSFVASEH